MASLLFKAKNRENVARKTNHKINQLLLKGAKDIPSSIKIGVCVDFVILNTSAKPILRGLFFQPS